MLHTDHSTPLAIKLAGAGADAGTFEGYASRFNTTPDSYGDIVGTGAFRKSLISSKQSGRAIAMLWSHNSDQPIGVWTEIKEDAIGLRVTGKLTLGIERARDAHALLKDGALGLSIGYRTVDSERTAGGRLLKEIDLWEISLVAMPAQSAAKITSVKSGGINPHQITRPGDFEKFLRDAGFSRQFAKTICSQGFKAAIGHRDDDGRRETVAAALKAAIQNLKGQ
jgi:HK97 family phage prohead protease